MRVKLKHYKNYELNGSYASKTNLIGEIYELYCYEYVLKTCKDVKIIDKFSVKSGIKNGFCVEDNKIIYKNHGILLGEFDILGIGSGELFWWEVSSSKKNTRLLNKRVSKKQELLAKVLPNMKINFSLIVAESRFSKFDNIVLPIPNFNFEEFYSFNDNLRSDICVSELNNLAREFDYVEELIENSKCYFDPIKVDFSSNLFERLYDLSTIFSNEIRYFDLIKKEYGKIIRKNKKYYKNDKILESCKATYIEITAIIKRFENKKIL
jgi:hypothetical protein